MKYLLLPGLLLAIFVQAQESALDPSIFDGTGRELEKVEAENTPAASEASPSAPEEAVPSAGASEPAEETVQETAEEEAPREIVLPGSQDEKSDEDPEAESGIPASQGSGKSRAGETVNSTEKIQPGQAVDFPWDM